MMLVSRRTLRTIRSTPAATLTIRLAFRGDRVYCPCCKSHLRGLRAVCGPDRVCWVCGSSERHRSLSLYLDDHPEMLHADMSILHVAPEDSLRRRFESVAQVRYVAGDLDTYFGAERIDVTDLRQFEDGSFDAVICNHVLEHVGDDRAAMCELRRVLKRGGWGLLLVPDVRETTTDEDPTVTHPAERTRRFGQHDHVRQYGWDYVDRLRDAGFEVKVELPAELWSADTIRHLRLRKFGELEPLFIVG